MKRIICSVALLSTTLAPLAWAEDAEAENEEVAEEATPKTSSKKYFHILPLCSRIEGKVEVLALGGSEWQSAEEGRAYPLGTSFRTQDPESHITLSFGAESFVKMTGAGMFSTSVKPLGDKTREVILGSGEINVSLPRTLPKGSFTVSSRGFVATDLAGDSRYTTELLTDGDKVSIRCVTGVLSVKGRHFEVLPMRAAQEFAIRTSQDALATIIYGVSGDLTLVLDQGAAREADPESGEMKVVEKTLEWKLTPKTSVRILRAVPDIGERLAVTVMTFNAGEELINRCAFTEGRPEVNTGELQKHEKSEEELKAEKARAEKAKALLGADVKDDAATSEDATESEESSSSEEDADF